MERVFYENNKHNTSTLLPNSIEFPQTEMSFVISSVVKIYDN